MGWKKMLKRFILNFQSNGKIGHTEINTYQQKIKYLNRLHDVIEITLEKTSEDCLFFFLEDAVLILNLCHLPICPGKGHDLLSFIHGKVRC